MTNWVLPETGGAGETHTTYWQHFELYRCQPPSCPPPSPGCIQTPGVSSDVVGTGQRWAFKGGRPRNSPGPLPWKCQLVPGSSHQRPLPSELTFSHGARPIRSARTRALFPTVFLPVGMRGGRRLKLGAGSAGDVGARSEGVTGTVGWVGGDKKEGAKSQAPPKGLPLPGRASTDPCQGGGETRRELPCAKLTLNHTVPYN